MKEVKITNWKLAKSIIVAYANTEISRPRFIYEFANWQKMQGKK
jgi:hypothetical protein